MQQNAQELWGNDEVTAYIGDTVNFLGCCGLKPRPGSSEEYEMGFHLLPAAWGHGYATEAAQKVITYAFETMQARALFAGHHPLNAASKRVLVKVGFQLTGQEFYPPTGLDHPLYRLNKPSIE